MCHLYFYLFIMGSFSILKKKKKFVSRFSYDFDQALKNIWEVFCNLLS